ncbi:unnamed protein product [Arctia plantaginis]|uniref:cystathionine gamma-lyase n=1 Tax=Arctia plantaginis TaxID=874455 RepID=A0A8S1BEQ2_ARCPL|nr:unnamed protein product [Arctia plantaginis]
MDFFYMYYITNTCVSNDCKMANQEFLEQKPGFATTAIHCRVESKETCTGVVQPIVTAATFQLSEPVVEDRIYYSRCGNPNRYSLEHCLAELEGGKYGFAFSSGHGAMSTICMMLSQGDHLLTDNEIYAGTACLFRKIISRMGIEITFTDFTNIKNIENSIQKNTKMVWVETPTNPTIKLLDIAAISKLAKSRGDILVCVDNTFLTSYFQKPLDLGADISMFSATKYINGHSDVVMGAAIVKDEKIAKILKSLQMYVGAVPSPMDCYLVTRSLTTLSLRMERHQQSSLTIAKWLLTQNHVLEVLHPGLPEHPQHELAKRQSFGHSGVFSFRHSGEFRESKTFLCALKLFALCISLGGTRSLVQLPSTMTHAVLSEKQRIDIGVTDSLIRLSIGLEDPEDLIKDLDQAFKEAFHK